MFSDYSRNNAKRLFRLACGVSLPLAVTCQGSPAAVDVAVVGAGFSGLVAARSLVAANKSVLVLEARDRLGGRVFDTHFPDGTSTYLGAQYVGAAQTKMVALSKEMGVELTPSYQNGSNVLYYNGTRFLFSAESTLTGDLPIDAASVAQMASTEETLNSWASELYPAAPWNHPRAQEWDAQTFATWLQSNVPSDSARYVFELATSSGFSEEPGAVSFLSALVSIRTAGNETSPGTFNDITSGAQSMICKGGCQNIAIKLGKLLGRSRIRLDSPVRSVEKTQDGYEVTTDTGIVAARKVVIAMPPPMAARIRYAPPLPAWRDQLTQRTPMGSVTKVLVQYQKPFWRDQGLSGQSFSNSGLAFVTADVSPEDGSSGVLLGFVEADRARSIDGKSSAEIKALITKDFVNYFGPHADNATAWEIQQWDEEEYTRGAYGITFPPGTLTKYGKYLAAPYEGIHFAGVETSLFWRGYMDGAISAGERVAEEVVSSLGKA